MYSLIPSAPIPSAIVASVNRTNGDINPFVVPFSISSLKIVSPQNPFIKIFMTEYKTIKLVKIPIAPNQKYSASNVPLVIKTLPRKPLNGGIPDKDKAAIKKIHPK